MATGCQVSDCTFWARTKPDLKDVTTRKRNVSRRYPACIASVRKAATPEGENPHLAVCLEITSAPVPSTDQVSCNDDRIRRQALAEDYAPVARVAALKGNDDTGSVHRRADTDTSWLDLIMPSGPAATESDLTGTPARQKSTSATRR